MEQKMATQKMEKEKGERNPSLTHSLSYRQSRKAATED